MATVLDSVDSVETAKIFDFDPVYAAYNYDVNAIAFTMLSFLLRGLALNVYHSTAKLYPFDGHALLLRLHFNVEGVQRGDQGKFMEEMRALRIDDRVDPNPLLHDAFRALADKHPRYHTDFDNTARVETMLVVLEKSADASPYEVPLYQGSISDLCGIYKPSFDTLTHRIRRVWLREAISRLARSPPPAPGSGGVGDSPPPSGGGRVMAFRSCTVLAAEGRWEDTGGPYRIWNGQGRPCMVPPSPVPDDVPPTAEHFPRADAPSTDEDDAEPPTLAMIAGYESQEDWPALRDGPLRTPPTAAADLTADPNA
ncbi:hypothetical protein CYMTET_42325 [Cymbomonas tetramitiformis]|uniref:Uncharacterized protein n=1 Tax=Cymbomonas tetramitiformis TaxID=36881 RepID=A0AAE0C4B9_9CHLO|nr:hypothetical protein CYMTET_42325 [Cymbomonas tetramitiformis]